MKCPFCKTTLVKGKEKQFTNTSDHVLDPNDEYERPLRKTYVCPGKCEFSVNGFWDEQGGWYSGKIDFLKFFEWERKNKRNSNAIGSWDEWMDNKQKFASIIRPYIFWGKYKYDISSKISNAFFNIFEPKFFHED